MSQCSRTIPVGILVSVSGPPRRRRTSIDKLPSIRKEVNLPLRVGIGVGVALTVVVALTSLVAYGVNRRAPAIAVAPVRNDVAVTKPIAPVEAPAAIAEIEPAAPPPASVAAGPIFGVEAMQPQQIPAAPAVRQLANPAPAAAKAAPVCSHYGTAVTFFENPPDAFRQAAKENKLVLMVHLSGNFDDPAFT